MKRKEKKEKVKRELPAWMVTGKQLWGNTRYKALIKLALYILFFVVVFQIINFRSGDKNPKQDLSPASFKSYSYQYTIEYVGASDEPIKTFHVNGKQYLDTNYFTIIETGKSYLEKNNHYYEEETLSLLKEDMFFDFSKITPAQLEKYRLSMQLEYNSRYTDGTVKKNYVLSTPKFAKLYLNEEVQKEGNVSISFYEKEDVLQKVEMDMRSYIGMKIEILYQDINKVKDFRGDYPVESEK